MPQTNKIILLVTSLIILAVNIFIVSTDSLQAIRVSRVFTSISFLIILLIVNSFRDRQIGLIFLCFLIADICMLKYEEIWFGRSCLLFFLISYVILIFRVSKKVVLKNLSKFMISVFIVITAVNIYMIHELIEITQIKIYDPFHKLIIYLIGVIHIALTLIASNYNLKYNTKQSMYFTYLSVAIIFGDLCTFIAYYLEMSSFYYPDRVLHIFGFTALTYYATISFNNKEEFDVSHKELYLD